MQNPQRGVADEEEKPDFESVAVGWFFVIGCCSQMMISPSPGCMLL